MKLHVLLTVCWLAGLCYGASWKPNVILMLADDMGYGDLGYVNPKVLTPNIDKLAHEGVILTNSYVMNVCTPTRHCVMTGRYPFKTHMAHIFIFPLQGMCAPLDIKFMPEYFKDHGYNTLMVGKWHLGFCREECVPINRGFDHFYGLYQGEQDYYTLSSGPPGIDGYDWRRQDKIDWSVKGTHNMYLQNDYILDKVRNYNDEKPFFMYLAFTAPHGPLDSPEKYLKYYEGYHPGSRAHYLGLTTSLDSAIGNLTKALKETGHYENTLIIFSSDNGGTHDQTADMGKLRGSKGSMFEGGIKALGFVHGPMLKRVGYKHNGLFHATDWLPTIMRILGDDDFDYDGVDGIDQSDMILNGGPSKRDDVVFNIDMRPFHMMGQAAVRKGNYKLLWGGFGATDGYSEHDNLTLFYKVWEFRRQVGLDPYENTEEGRAHFDFSVGNKENMQKILDLWKFERGNMNSGLTYLFDLEEDPYERNNLAGNNDFAAKLREMKEFVLEQLEDYREAPLELLVNRESAHPRNWNGTWNPGWCNDLDQNLNE